MIQKGGVQYKVLKEAKPFLPNWCSRFGSVMDLTKLATMACRFCENENHNPENCMVFPDFRSRVNQVKKLRLKNCFCVDDIRTFNKCCNKQCEICFQNHHIALCPKRGLICYLK